MTHCIIGLQRHEKLHWEVAVVYEKNIQHRGRPVPLGAQNINNLFWIMAREDLIITPETNWEFTIHRPRGRSKEVKNERPIIDPLKFTCIQMVEHMWNGPPK